MSKSNAVKKALRFLLDEYDMQYIVRELPDTQGVNCPTYLYSFYNQNGCLTIKEIAQAGEWDCYVASKFDDDPYKCIQQMVNQKEYLNRTLYFSHSYLKGLAKFIRNSITETGDIWGISVDKTN